LVYATDATTAVPVVAHDAAHAHAAGDHANGARRIAPEV
jgi:hypothetical protein